MEKPGKIIQGWREKEEKERESKRDIKQSFDTRKKWTCIGWVGERDGKRGRKDGGKERGIGWTNEERVKWKQFIFRKECKAAKCLKPWRQTKVKRNSNQRSNDHLVGHFKRLKKFSQKNCFRTKAFSHFPGDPGYNIKRLKRKCMGPTATLIFAY